MHKKYLEVSANIIKDARASKDPKKIAFFSNRKKSLEDLYNKYKSAEDPKAKEAFRLSLESLMASYQKQYQ